MVRGLLKERGLRDSSLTPEALQVVVFSDLMGDAATTRSTTTEHEVTTSTRSTTAGAAVEPATPEDVPLDDSMAEPDVGVLDGAGGETEQADGLTFDCHDGEAVWTSGWSQYKISWCCEHEQIGCEAMTSSDPYDCQAGLSRWERGWSANKMAWCCAHRQLACSTTAPPDNFDCDAGYAHCSEGGPRARPPGAARTGAFAATRTRRARILRSSPGLALSPRRAGGHQNWAGPARLPAGILPPLGRAPPAPLPTA